MGMKLGLILREEYRLRVFENLVLRSIFGPKRDVVTGGWKKLHNEELHNLYSSPGTEKSHEIIHLRQPVCWARFKANSSRI
jgi:hypothetical protein